MKMSFLGDFMKNGLMIFMGMAIFSLNADEPVCHRCEEIREYNAKYHVNYEYYEDYLKAEKNKQAPPEKTIPKPDKK
jgi:hypothetical protein